MCNRYVSSKQLSLMEVSILQQVYTSMLELLLLMKNPLLNLSVKKKTRKRYVCMHVNAMCICKWQVVLEDRQVLAALTMLLVTKFCIKDIFIS